MNFHGTDNFTVIANDGALDSLQQTIAIVIDPVNDAPAATDQIVSTGEDMDVTINLAGSDVDGGDVITFALDAPPLNGSLSGEPPTLTYDPNPNFNGSDSFTFITNDGTLDSDPGTVTVNVHSSNDPPVADDNSVSTGEDTPVDFSLTASDIDGDALTFMIVDPPANGVITGDSPEFTYTPNANFNGSDEFTFVANDGQEDSAEATVTLTINPENDAPVADNQPVTTPEDTTTTITLTGSRILMAIPSPLA